jgi:PelA/Pel-15E family pectate lyase
VRSQIRQNGRLTAWCAQHDQQTLEPAWARAYEPPSLSGSETVGIVRFLMSVDKPTPQIVASIEGAVSWFRSVAMPGVRVDRVVRPDGRTERILVTDPNAPPLWARFYELGTNRPLYVDRDSVYRYDYSQISYERRSGYAYHSDTPALLLREDYPRWRARHALP